MRENTYPLVIENIKQSQGPGIFPLGRESNGHPICRIFFKRDPALSLRNNLALVTCDPVQSVNEIHSPSPVKPREKLVSAPKTFVLPAKSYVEARSGRGPREVRRASRCRPRGARRASRYRLRYSGVISSSLNYTD